MSRSLSQQYPLDLSSLLCRVAQIKFKEMATAPITGAFLGSLPKPTRQSIVGAFKQAANPELSDTQREALLLQALGQDHSNPFVAFRLACWYTGCGSIHKARGMMQKATHLAVQRKIDFSVLENS